MKNKYYTNETLFSPSSWTVTFNCHSCGKQVKQPETNSNRLCVLCTIKRKGVYKDHAVSIQ